MSSDTNKRPKEKAISTSQALRKKLGQSKAEAKTIAKAKPDKEKIQTTAFVEKSLLKKPKREAAFKGGHGNNVGLYIYTLLKKYRNFKWGIKTIVEAVNYAIYGGADTLEADDKSEGEKTVRRVCQNLSDLFGEPMEQSVIAKLIKDECGGVIKEEVLKGTKLYYFSDPQSPEYDFVVNQKDVKDKVVNGLLVIADELYENSGK